MIVLTSNNIFSHGIMIFCSKLPSVSSPFFNDGKNIAVYHYISPRNKPNLSTEEALIREISYRIKNKNDSEAINLAASAMAKYVNHNSILIPVPSSSGLTDTNMALASAISLITDSKIVDALTRKEKVLPLHEQRKLRGLDKPVTIEEHKISIKGIDLISLIGNSTVYLVDNVITSGSTINACRDTLNMPDALGIAFSKAGIY